MQISELAKKQYAWVESMNWHNKTTLESLALIASEVGEAINECRGQTPTERLPAELADIILRTVDLAEVLGIDIEQTILDKLEINLRRTFEGKIK